MWKGASPYVALPYFTAEKFRPKSSFNLRNKDAIIETYLSCLEEILLDIEISSKWYNNLTKDERNALYNLKDDPCIIIKGADKGSAIVIWDIEVYLKGAYKQLYDREVYEELLNDPNVLINTIMKALEKIRLHGDLSSDTLNYFLVEDPKFAKFCLLPKTRKHLHDILCRWVILNCTFYTENISSFLDHHLQPLAQRVKQMWNCYWNEVCTSLWYSFYGWSQGKNNEHFWKKPPKKQWFGGGT